MPDDFDLVIKRGSISTGAPIVAGESDFTHDAVRDRLNVELYRTPSEEEDDI